MKNGDGSGGNGAGKGVIKDMSGGSSQKKGISSAPSKTPTKPAATKSTGGQKASDRSGGRFKQGGLVERRKK